MYSHPVLGIHSAIGIHPAELRNRRVGRASQVHPHHRPAPPVVGMDFVVVVGMMPAAVLDRPVTARPVAARTVAEPLREVEFEVEVGVGVGVGVGLVPARHPRVVGIEPVSAGTAPGPRPGSDFADSLMYHPWRLGAPGPHLLAAVVDNGLQAAVRTTWRVFVATGCAGHDGVLAMSAWRVRAETKSLRMRGVFTHLRWACAGKGFGGIGLASTLKVEGREFGERLADSWRF